MPKALPPPLPEALAPDEQETNLTQSGEALILQNNTAGIYLMGASLPPLGRDVSPMAFGLYVERLLDEAGNPSDPIERMLIEQIALAHHAIGRLHVEAATARTIEHAKVATTAAARLLGEFRRCTLTLKRYREPTPRPVTLVQQQNLSAGDQQVAYVEQPRSAVTTKNDASIQQTTSEIKHAESQLDPAQSSSVGGGKTEPAFDAGRPGTAPTIGAADQAVGEVNWTPDTGRPRPECAKRKETANRSVVSSRAPTGGSGDMLAAGANGSLPPDGRVAVGHERPGRLGVDWQRLVAIRTQLVGSTPAPQARAEPLSQPPPPPLPAGRTTKRGKGRGQNRKDLVSAQ